MRQREIPIGLLSRVRGVLFVSVEPILTVQVLSEMKPRIGQSLRLLSVLLVDLGDPAYLT